MSTVSMMLENAERLSEARALAQHAAQASRQRSNKSAQDEQEEEDKDVDDHLLPS